MEHVAILVVSSDYDESGLPAVCPYGSGWPSGWLGAVRYAWNAGLLVGGHYDSCLNWPRRYCLGIVLPLLPSLTSSHSSIHSQAAPARGGGVCAAGGTILRGSGRGG
jgi:hypothetical protein